jgi:cobalt-precorrin-5B (C1)-methyltransferase
MDLHSGRSQVDFARLGEMAASAGTDAARVATANTALEALQIAGPPLAEAVAAEAAEVVADVLRDAPIAVEIIVIDRQGAIQARRGFAR